MGPRPSAPLTLGTPRAVRDVHPPGNVPPYGVPRDTGRGAVTTIAAVARDGAVWMAADSATNVYERPIVDGARKVRRLIVGDSEECLIGMCGAGGLADLIGLRLKLTHVPSDDEDLQSWAAAVAWAVTELAQDAGLVDAGRIDGSLALGFRGRLWTLSETHAIPHPDGVNCLGSGEGPAIGALDVLLEQDLDPLEAVTRAVAIGINRDRNSRAPIYVEYLPAREV